MVFFGRNEKTNPNGGMYCQTTKSQQKKLYLHTGRHQQNEKEVLTNHQSNGFAQTLFKDSVQSRELNITVPIFNS